MTTLEKMLEALKRSSPYVYYSDRETLKQCAAAIAAGEAELRREPDAHMYPSDLLEFQERETFAHAYSVAVGCPSEESVPLYTREETK